MDLFSFLFSVNLMMIGSALVVLSIIWGKIGKLLLPQQTKKQRRVTARVFVVSGSVVIMIGIAVFWLMGGT